MIRTLILILSVASAVAAQSPSYMSVARIADDGTVEAQTVGYHLSVNAIGSTYELSLGGNPLLQADGVLIANALGDSGDASAGGELTGMAAGCTINTSRTTGGHSARPTTSAFFPFAAGWPGAHMFGTGALAASSLPAGSTVTRMDVGRYDLAIPNVDSRSDGIIFVVAAPASQDDRVATVLARPNGTWQIAVRNEDLSWDDGAFSLVYVDYQSAMEIGGIVEGDGTIRSMKGTAAVTRTAVGNYRIAIPGVTDVDDGMLLVECLDDQNAVPARVSYEWNAAASAFDVHVRQSLQGRKDHDFAFAYVAYDAPWGNPHPGSNEDLELASGVGAAPDAQPVEHATLGDRVTMELTSPGGLFWGSPYVLGGQLSATGMPPSSPAGFPEIQLDPAGPALFVILTDQSYPGGLSALTALGVSFSFDVPVALPSTSLLVQGIALDPLALNGIFGTTNGHEVRFD